MTRDRALKLLRGGEEGVAEWNAHRQAGVEVPELRAAKLPGAELLKVDLTDVALHDADLSGADLSDATLDRAQMFDVDLTGAQAARASLVKANLTDADLQLIRLPKADLTSAELLRANLRGAYLDEARFTGADLTFANLRESALVRADLRGARLERAILFDAMLTDAQVAGALMGRTDLSCGLTRVHGLDQVLHSAGSQLSQASLFSLANQLDPLPRTFLRGCGLTPWEVESVRLYNSDSPPEEIVEIQTRVFSLRTNGVVQVRPVFVSYSHQDREAVNRIQQALYNDGINCWRDIHDATAGPIGEQITEAMKNRLAVIVFSENSMSSGWCKSEIRKAIDLSRRQDRHVLCPIALDDTWKARLAGDIESEVRQFNVLDFSDWQNAAAFDEAFRKLAAGIRRWYT